MFIAVGFHYGTRRAKADIRKTGEMRSDCQLFCLMEKHFRQTKDTLEMIKIVTTGIRIVSDKLLCWHTHRNRQQFTWILGLIAIGTKIYVLDKSRFYFPEIKSGRILTRLLIFFPRVTQSDYNLVSRVSGPGNEAVRLRSGVSTTSEEFENAALFVRSGLPSTLIRHENEVFSKMFFNPEAFDNADSAF